MRLTCTCTLATLVLASVDILWATAATAGQDTTDEKAQGNDLINLPWADLKNELSSPDNLLDTTTADYVDQCAPEFEKDLWDRSNHNLIDQPSGICLGFLYTAFESCNPLAAEKKLTMVERWSTYIPPSETGNPLLTLGLTPTTFSKEKLQMWLDPENPSYNLPPKVLFPADARDVVAAVGFAKEHNVELSIKNSGHSYAGASTKKDTLHLNMNKYKRYSIDGPIECDSVQDAAMEEDLSNQVCKLALARGKPAALHVGGGENFDKTYRALKAWNEGQPEGYKYHVIGGYAGTVSPMGWTWQGGLASQNYGRKYGFGVDQVLQIEMVLPNGRHVRFGPTSWEGVDSYMYPKTTKVSGVCNERPKEDDESMWEWKACPEDINFDDLWFATRGGGGGTWGVILSVHLQLHDYFPVANVRTPIGTLLASPVEVPAALFYAAWDFMIDFLWQPTSLGLSEDDSNRCGNTDATSFWCYGDGAARVLQTAWRDYLRSEKATLVEMGVPSEFIDILELTAEDDSAITNYIDLAEALLISEGPNKGKAKDGPPPYIPSEMETNVNMLLPRKCILENRDYFIKNTFLVAPPSSFYFAFGANPGVSHDQTTSLSDAHREAGVMLFLDRFGFFSDYWPVFAELCYDLTDKRNFPSLFGSNHAGPNNIGPLKSDWTKSCPIDWSQQKREKECISQQEAIYGTKTLTRLEKVKSTIDPTYMFNCSKCIGNNLIITGVPAVRFKNEDNKCKRKRKKCKRSCRSKRGGKRNRCTDRCKNSYKDCKSKISLKKPKSKVARKRKRKHVFEAVN